MSAASHVCRYLQALLVIVVTGAVGLAGPPAPAQDLPPLRSDLQNLKNMPWGPQPDISFPPYVTLRADPFGVLAPYIDGLERLEEFGLVENPEDATALADFLQQALAARLRELGIEDEIQVRPLAPPLSDNVHGFADCSTLGMAVLFRAIDTVHEDRPVIAVVMQTVLWQWLPVPRATSPKCLPAERTKAAQPVSTNVFLVSSGERARTMTLAQDALLSTVDHAILYRLILTNRAARVRVKSWVLE